MSNLKCSQNARDRIMARLKASGTEHITVPQTPPLPVTARDPRANIEQLTELMTAMRTEIHLVDGDTWPETLRMLARQRGWKRLLYGRRGPLGPAIESAWPADDHHSRPELVAYTQPVETFKNDLFENLDVGITSARGAVADAGAIVLWPTPAEPRLMSLVPPVHVAVLDADTIHASLADMMALEKWTDGMPANALLISGPSKTADIEFTLVFGVHGPKELIVLIRK